MPRLHLPGTLLFVTTSAALLLAACQTPAGSGGTSEPSGWLAWRGPDQNGTSPETGLVDTVEVGGENHLWTYPIAGRGTPVVAGGRLFGLGYEGEGPTLREVLFCLDEKTGEELWSHRWSDFISDTIYTRYAIGAPTIDPETGNVFAMTGAGLVHAFTPEGEMLWEVSMMETLGRLTFPNGRVGAPVLLGDLVIVHYIFAAWGPTHGPASDRFFAFHKETGEVVWSSTPSGRPIDGSFSTAILEERDGHTLLYAGLGGGKVVCVDAKSGDPRWRFALADGGLNASQVIWNDTLVALNGKENVDTSTIGRMVGLDLTATPDEERWLQDAELWRNELCAFTSSPVLVDDLVYATTYTGDINCVDVKTGEVLWHHKLGPDQLHASPLWADGKLYVPITNGTFHILRPSREGCEVLDVEQLEGNCLGAPAVANGAIYVHTTKGLYCFGERREGTAPTWSAAAEAEAGEPVRLRIVPADVTFRAGESVSYRVESLDARGNVVADVPADSVTYEPQLGAGPGAPWERAKEGVAVVRASKDGLKGAARLRIVPSLPHVEDFSGYELNQADGTWAFPPGHWLGARIKWQVVDVDGERMIRRRMDNPLFQRTLSLFGHPDDANYTVQADVMMDGNRRSMAWAGVVNQRYLILIKGNPRARLSELEVSSNMEHLKITTPFVAKPQVWYTIKTRVDLEEDGTAVVRAKVWPRDEAEPDAWSIEARDPYGHTHGAAGVYGFTPQSRFTVFMDNIQVTPNE